MTVLERDVEDYLKNEVKKHGGEVRKLKWIGRRSAPDRLVFLQGVYFVELKRPGEKPRPDQIREHVRMQKKGARVCVLDSKEQVDSFISAITGADTWEDFLRKGSTKLS